MDTLNTHTNILFLKNYLLKIKKNLTTFSIFDKNFTKTNLLKSHTLIGPIINYQPANCNCKPASISTRR